MAPTHPHEHTKHTLKDVIEALPRYEPLEEGTMLVDDNGSYLKLADVRVLVAKAATLGAPVAPDAPSTYTVVERLDRPGNRAGLTPGPLVDYGD